MEEEAKRLARLNQPVILKKTQKMTNNIGRDGWDPFEFPTLEDLKGKEKVKVK